MLIHIVIRRNGCAEKLPEGCSASRGNLGRASKQGKKSRIQNIICSRRMRKTTHLV